MCNQTTIDARACQNRNKLEKKLTEKYILGKIRKSQIN